MGDKNMTRRTIRWTVATLLVILGAACPAAGIAFAGQSGAQAEAAAQPGTLTALDREFLTVIRFANLWEIPMGDLAAERGNSQVVRDVGAVLAADHTKLDVAVKQLADQFDVQLPDKATSSQQHWMDDIRGKTGDAFDSTFADRLRAAHGTVFGLVAEIRAGTRNDVIRGFAQQANVIVMKHMTLLEGTGHVSAEHGMFAEASARTAQYPENTLARGDIILAVVVALLMAAATIGILRSFSANGTARQ
jgi:predicted outer membrane protein